jgi:hemerythrin-like metal-binding protein
MNGIRWRSSMAIDGGVIDHDHRHLIDIINRFGEHVSLGTAGVSAAVDVLHALKVYAETHFVREEGLQRLIDFPEADLHHDEHQRLLTTLGGIIAKTSSVTEADTATVVPELISLLRSWLLDHVIKQDLRMKPYARLMNRHAKSFPELRQVVQQPSPAGAP